MIQIHRKTVALEPVSITVCKSKRTILLLFLVQPPSGTMCLSTSHLRRHSRFSDNDSRPFCFRHVARIVSLGGRGQLQCLGADIFRVLLYCYKSASNVNYFSYQVY